MKRYQNLSGDTGVRAYDYGPTWIRIHFMAEGVYEYTRASVGLAHLTEMKRRADEGRGLSTYISQNPQVRNGYARRLA